MTMSEQSCLVCGRGRPFAVWHEASGVGVCAPCRDARNVVEYGAALSTERSYEEFKRAVDRVMAHYVGEDAPVYGDARFLVDYALGLLDSMPSTGRARRETE